MDAIAEHEEKMLKAFGAVLAAEDKMTDAKRRLDEATTLIGQEKTAAENELRVAWDAIAALMEETGEPEVVLPGEVTDFKIGWSNPPERVKVEPDAVPEEFCKIERKPKLKDIGDYLKGLREQGAAFPNWASFERGEPKLGWKSIKRSTYGG
jgi:hypothetical protein